MTGCRRWISSMKRTSPRPSDVRMPARSPLRSSAGPDVTRICEPISRASRNASVVLPRPGGPEQQHVIERVASLARRLDVDRQVVGHLPLPDELGEAARPQRRVVVQLAHAAASGLRGRPPGPAARRSGPDRRVAGAPSSLPPRARPALHAPGRARVGPDPAAREAARSRPACTPAGRARRRRPPAVRRRRAPGRAPPPARRLCPRARSGSSRAAPAPGARPSSGPRPWTCVNRPTSPVAMARTSSLGLIPARIASATRGPTP